MAYGTYDQMVWLSEVNVDGGVNPADEALEVAAGDLTWVWTLHFPFLVVEFGYFATVAFNYDTQITEGVIALDRQILPGSAIGRVEVGRVDLEDGTAISAGRRVPPGVISSFANAEGSFGDRLIVRAVTAATGGGSIAGDWQPYVLLATRAATAANMTDLTETAITQVAT